MYNGGGYYRMDSNVAGQRPYYGYPNNMMLAQNYNGGYNQARGSFYGGGWGGPRPANNAAGATAGKAGGGGVPASGFYTGHGAVQGHPNKQAVPGPFSQLGRTNSFSLSHGNGSQAGSGFGSAFGSFRNLGGVQNSNNNGSQVSNPDAQLPRVNSGMNFGYSYGSFVSNPAGGPAPSNTSLMNLGDAAGGKPAHDAAANNHSSSNNAAGGGGGQLSREGSMYGYGSFANGLPGIGPSASFNSVSPTNGGGGVYNGYSTAGTSASAAMGGGKAGDDSGDVYNLQRQDSQNKLQRQYSIAGQFYNFGAPAHYNTGMMMGGVRPGVMLNGRSGGVLPGAGMGGMGFPFGQAPMGQMQMQMQMQMQQQQQRRLGDGGMKSSDDVITEGETTLLGRKNSVSNMLERKESQKRVGMYFKNKEADTQYKKDGDPGTTKTASSKARDASLVNNVKPILLYDTSEEGSGKGAENDVEIDGKTVRAVKPGNDEIQKYDMREVIFVNTREDVDVSGDSLDEIRDNFVGGSNVGMMMADADAKAAEPTEWFTWNALKAVMKNVFAKIEMNKSYAGSYVPVYEVTVSVCVLQDDQMLDLLGDDSDFDKDDYRLENLVVAESPLFGNVPNNAVFVVVENADEFGDTLDACLERARGFFHHEGASSDNNKNLDDVEEYGIILATCVLKQTRKSQSTGKIDIMVSSIFASGVGDGIIHYNRILDKNPAEPRALFYSVLHRSCHSTALFSLKSNNADIFSALGTLQRFSKVELRRPKVGSVRQFLAYSELTMPKIKEDLSGMKEGRQKIQTQRFKERLELMTQDMEVMLKDPEGCVPKTYI